MPPNFLNIHLNIILPSTSWSPKWRLFLLTELTVTIFKNRQVVTAVTECIVYVCVEQLQSLNIIQVKLCLERNESFISKIFIKVTQTLNNKRTLINPLQTKRRLLYLKTQSVPRCKHFSSRL
jgi:hypothetical protein